MPRKKKDHIDKLFDALEDKNLTKVELQLAERIIVRRMRSRSYSLPEVEDAGEVGKAEKADGGGPGKGKSGKKDKDGDVGPAAEEVREKGEPKEKE